VKAILIGAALVLLVSVGAGFGDPLCGAIVKHPEWDGDLGITSGQRQDLENVFEKTEKEIIESTGTMRVKQLEMDRLMRSDSPDMREMRKLVNEIGDARSAIVLAGIERDLRTREILGPDRMREAGRMVMRMGEGRRARFGERGMKDHGMPGMMRTPRCGMMEDHGRPGMRGMGRRESVMHGAGPGVPGMGYREGMMHGAEPGVPGMGYHRRMMSGEEKPGKREKARQYHHMKGRSEEAPGKSPDSQGD
jgi:Spy/CpxP family protein refolding chaperone